MRVTNIARIVVCVKKGLKSMTPKVKDPFVVNIAKWVSETWH